MARVPTILYFYDLEYVASTFVMRRKGRVEGSHTAMKASTQDDAHSSSSHSPMARTDHLYLPSLPIKGQATVILYSGEKTQMWVSYTTLSCPAFADFCLLYSESGISILVRKQRQRYHCEYILLIWIKLKSKFVTIDYRYLYYFFIPAVNC